MSSYLQSNQPYQRVDDGIIDPGVMSGAMIGGALAGGTHMFGKKGLQALGSRAMDKRAKANTVIDNFSQDVTDSKMFDKAAKQFDKADKRLSNVKTAYGHHNKTFNGGWKGKAAAYGGSIIAGGIIGDAFND